jgi:ribonuclease Z
MAEIIFLGTAGYLPTAGRDNTAFLLKAGEASILIDCPGSIVRKVLAARTKPLDIGSVFITHVHTDHVYGLPSLVHGLMLRDHVFRLFGSAETVDFCGRLLDLFGLREPKVKTRIELVALVLQALALGLEVLGGLDLLPLLELALLRLERARRVCQP